jgi:hypothetical protein
VTLSDVSNNTNNMCVRRPAFGPPFDLYNAEIFWCIHGLDRKQNMQQGLDRTSSRLKVNKVARTDYYQTEQYH